jgi:hypothetical protein
VHFVLVASTNLRAQICHYWPGYSAATPIRKSRGRMDSMLLVQVPAPAGSPAGYGPKPIPPEQDSVVESGGVGVFREFLGDDVARFLRLLARQAKKSFWSVSGSGLPEPVTMRLEDVSHWAGHCNHREKAIRPVSGQDRKAFITSKTDAEKKTKGGGGGGGGAHQEEGLTESDSYQFSYARPRTPRTVDWHRKLQSTEAPQGDDA